MKHNLETSAEELSRKRARLMTALQKQEQVMLATKEELKEVERKIRAQARKADEEKNAKLFPERVAAIVDRGPFKSLGKRSDLVACNSPFGKYLANIEIAGLYKRSATLKIDVTREIHDDDYEEWTYRPVRHALMLHNPDFDYPLEGTIWGAQIASMLKERYMRIDNVKVQDVESVYNTGSYDDTSDANFGFIYNPDRSAEAVLGEAGTYCLEFYVVQAKHGAEMQKTLAEYANKNPVAILYETPAGRALKDDMDAEEETVPIRLVDQEWVYDLSETSPLLKAALTVASPAANNLSVPAGLAEKVWYFVFNS